MTTGTPRRGRRSVADVTAFVVQSDALPSWYNLGALLADLADRGGTTPCMTDPSLFVSDQVTERAAAAYSCTAACPVVNACAAFADANAEPAHVWGGRDRTRRPYQRKESA